MPRAPRDLRASAKKDEMTESTGRVRTNEDRPPSSGRSSTHSSASRPAGPGKPTVAPDPVNQPMIRHWAYALADMNPVYLDPEFAAKSRFGGIVSPPVMLQTWTMPSPKIEGIAERGGVPMVISRNPTSFIDEAGFTGIVATNSEFEIDRYPRLGDVISVTQRMADAFIDVEAIRWTTWHAAWLVAEGRPADREAASRSSGPPRRAPESRPPPAGARRHRASTSPTPVPLFPVGQAERARARVGLAAAGPPRQPHTKREGMTAVTLRNPAPPR